MDNFDWKQLADNLLDHLAEAYDNDVVAQLLLDWGYSIHEIAVLGFELPSEAEGGEFI
jgi:hypothetical protein